MRPAPMPSGQGTPVQCLSDGVTGLRLLVKASRMEPAAWAG